MTRLLCLVTIVLRHWWFRQSHYAVGENISSRSRHARVRTGARDNACARGDRHRRCATRGTDLFGRVVDALSKGEQAFPIIGVWAALGLFNIIATAALAIMADRLAHRQRLAAMSMAFERAITLPISYHAERGSGRVVRIMLAGTDQLFALWLSFLREHLTAIIGIVLLIPAAISVDFRLAALLAGWPFSTSLPTQSSSSGHTAARRASSSIIRTFSAAWATSSAT